MAKLATIEGGESYIHQGCCVGHPHLQNGYFLAAQTSVWWVGCDGKEILVGVK